MRGTYKMHKTWLRNERGHLRWNLLVGQRLVCYFFQQVLRTLFKVKLKAEVAFVVISVMYNGTARSDGSSIYSYVLCIQWKMPVCFFAGLLGCLQRRPAEQGQLKHMVTTQKWNRLGAEATIWRRPASRRQWPAACGAADSSSWEALSELLSETWLNVCRSKPLSHGRFLPNLSSSSMGGWTAQWQFLSHH